MLAESSYGGVTRIDSPTVQTPITEGGTVTVVLVHGNPETDAIWGPLVDALGHEDVVPLSPPGFGAPLPDDFPATYIANRDWLEGQLETGHRGHLRRFRGNAASGG
jgi:pimeloyl-ACP methyl ester carboxylesterase